MCGEASAKCVLCESGRRGGGTDAELPQQATHVEYRTIIAIRQPAEQIGRGIEGGAGFPLTLESGVNTPAAEVYCVSGVSRDTCPVSPGAKRSGSGRHPRSRGCSPGRSEP